MKKTLLLAVMLTALLSAVPVFALDVEGVKLDDSAALGGETLVLNGAGVRKKFVIKVYVGALYLASKTSDADAAITMPGPKRVIMHFLYKEVEAAKIASAWTDGMKDNLSQAEFDALRQRLDAFNRLFPTMRKGDRAVIDYSPQSGLRVSINGKDVGGVEGEDFMRALLRVWLGSKPVDSGLKDGMLGKGA